MNLQDQMKNGGSDKDLLVVHSVLTENNAMSRPIRRGSTVRISNGRVHVDDPNKPMAPTTAAGGFSQTMPATGVVPAGATMPCPPTCDPCAGQAVTPVVYEGAVQTQPCPPGM